MNPNNKVSEKVCVICYDSISSNPTHEEEKEKVLNCSHIFHRECIGEWLKLKHNCPVCRAHIESNTPEAPKPEMTAEEILAVPDSQLFNDQTLLLVQNTIQQIRYFRILDLNENNQVSNNARKAISVASRICGWH